MYLSTRLTPRKRHASNVPTHACRKNYKPPPFSHHMCAPITHHLKLDIPPIQGLGIWIVLLTINDPCSTKSPTIGWNSKMPLPIVPHGTFSNVQPLCTQYAMRETKARDVGIGVPSKYCDFPVASLGSMATVTLKRARRVRPQSTKMVRKT